jgi:cyanophycinase
MMKGLLCAFVLIVCSLVSVSLPAQNRKAKGNLFIIGGGNRSEALIRKMVTTADIRDNDYIVVLPMASAEPETGYAFISRQLAPHTKVVVRNFDFSKHDVNDRRWLDSLRAARLIYILGGDQNRFMKVVLNTSVYEAYP